MVNRLLRPSTRLTPILRRSRQPTKRFSELTDYDSKGNVSVNFAGSHAYFSS